MKIIRESSLPKIENYSFFKMFAENSKRHEMLTHCNDYKRSKYNVEEMFDGSAVIYNVASDGIVLLEKNEIGNLFDTNDLEEWTDPKGVFESLIKIGVLVPKKIDEDLILSLVRQKQIIRPENELKIAINVTYNCNAKCDYCFECGADRNKMSYETADSVADYICKNVNEDTLLTYRWFGGEPLLATNIIDRIINRVNEYFNYKLKYRSVILSNGTIYDKEILNKIHNNWRVYQFHVTIDGDKETNNNKKKFINKNLDGYSITMNLIRQLLKDNILVVCRINIDKINIKCIEKIAEEFTSFPNKEFLKIYAAPTRRHTKSSESYCFDYSEYDEAFDYVYSVLYKHGLLGNVDVIVPKRKITCCSTRAINELVVSTKGEFVKCMQTSTTDQKVIGNCTDGLTLNEELSQWLLPKTPDECKDCKYMPICQGGCKGFRSLNNALISPCTIEKYYLKTILKYVYKMNKE